MKVGTHPARSRAAEIVGPKSAGRTRPLAALREIEKLPRYAV